MEPVKKESEPESATRPQPHQILEVTAVLAHLNKSKLVPVQMFGLHHQVINFSYHSLTAFTVHK